MALYTVKAQGYGGGGPSVSPFESTDRKAVADHIADLIASDHAVQLYKIVDGNKINVEFTEEVTYHIVIEDDDE